MEILGSKMVYPKLETEIENAHDGFKYLKDKDLMKAFTFYQDLLKEQRSRP